MTAVLAAGASGCARKAPPLVVGSNGATDRNVVAEVTAQLLEKQLGTPVIRKFEIGGTQIAYESLMLGTVNIYPEETNAVVVAILKEPIDPNPDIVYERVRGEMQRLARIVALKPLGVHGRMTMVIRASDQKAGGMTTLSQAAKSKLAWTLAYTNEFEARNDGYTALMSTYKLPLQVAPRAMPATTLYPALMDNQVSMIAGRDTDGPLEGEGFAVLKDDLNAFGEARTCLFAGQEALGRDPRTRPALEALSGRFTNDSVRRAAYRVAVMKGNLKDVAEQMLKDMGL